MATNTPCTSPATPGPPAATSGSRRCMTEDQGHGRAVRRLWRLGARQLVAEPGDDTSEEATQTWDRSGPWEPRIRAECEAVRDAAGVLDLPGFSRFMVEGEDTREWLSSLITGVVPKPGRIGLGYFADEKGPDRDRDVDHGAA